LEVRARMSGIPKAANRIESLAMPGEGPTDQSIPALKAASVAFITGTSLLAISILFVLFLAAGQPSWRDASVGLAMLAFLSAAYRRPLPFGPHTHLVLDSAVLLAAALLLPGNLAMVVALAGPLFASVPNRGPWVEPIFNGSQAALQVAAVNALLGPLGWERAEPFADLRFIVAVPVAGALMYAVNTIAIGAMLAIQEGSKIPEVVRRAAGFDRAELTGHAVQLGLALLAVIVADGHPWGLILLALPGIVVFEAFDRHVRLRLQAEAQLTYQAFHDPLTGLANRSHLMRLIESELASPQSTKQVAVFFLDLDGFKQINDAHGHEVGDQVLVEVAGRLRQCVSPSDLVGRLGGDEFIIVSGSRSDAISLWRLAERVLARISEQPVLVAGELVRIGASIGIAVAGSYVTSARELVRDADHALYRAKRSGRGRVAISGPMAHHPESHSDLTEQFDYVASTNAQDLVTMPIGEFDLELALARL
jgi:diguanylate cyclase (GGDEF)-like protein